MNSENIKNKLLEKLYLSHEEKIEENHNIKISYLNKKMYEQGFIDGVNLLLECLYK